MKPIKLVLKYIGPHLDTTIDFDKLEDFFLISGETGAGKTFIFDSIIHSIYGEPKQETYEERDKSLVSCLKPPLEVPSIEYTFSIGAAIYRVFRTLSYQKPTKKTKENATARLELLDSKSGEFVQLENEVKAINERLEKLIGLSKDEFKKIVILPQGEFQKFLKMTPGDKKKFLIEVFKDTQIFANIKRKVSQDCRNNKKEIEVLVESLEKRCEEINYQNSDNLIEEYKTQIKNLTEKKSEITKNQLELTGKLTEAKNILQEAESNKINLLKKETLEKQESEIKSKQKKVDDCMEAQKINLPYNSWKTVLADFSNIQNESETLSKKIMEAEKRLSELESEKNAIEDNRKELVNNEKEIEKVQKQLAKITEVETAEKRTASAEKLYKEAQAETNSLNDLKQQVFKKLVKTTECENPETDKLLLRLSEEKNLLENERTILENQKAKAEENLNTEDSIKNYEAELCKEKTKLELQEKQKNNLNELKEKNYAYFLALNLSDNSPCPVCGSTNHPKKAGKPDFSQCKELIDTTLEQALLDAESVYSETNRTVTTLSAKLEQLTQQLAANHLEITLEQIKEQLHQVENKLSELKTKTENCSDLINQLSEVEEKIKTSEHKEAENHTLFNSCKTEYETLKKEHFEGKEVHKEELETLCETLKTKNQNLRTKIENWEKEYQIISKTYSELSGQKTSVEKQAVELKDKKQKAEEDFNKALKKSVFKSAQEIEAAFLEENVRIVLEKEIKNWENELKEVQVKLESSKTTISPEEAKNNLEEINAKINDSKTLLETIEKELTDLTEKNATLENNLQDIENRKQNILQLKEKQKPLELLNKHLSGSPEIDTWATKLYFTNILAFANNRFKEITNNTYEFIFGSSNKEGIKEDELDISIIDYTTNITRHCSTLSGGEEFLASISLALGLADAIQCQHSNAQIESMFIDEGFGSLGIEVQNKAVEVLRKLNDTRKIGIISHSENIETEIDSRLKVEKENGISTVTHYLREIVV